MDLYTIPGPCASAYVRHNFRVFNTFIHIFSYTYLDCHVNINMGIKSHMDLYPAYVNILTAMFWSKTVCPIKEGLCTGACVPVYMWASPPPPHADIPLFHLAKEQEFPWDSWQLVTDLEWGISYVFPAVIQRSLRWNT